MSLIHVGTVLAEHSMLQEPITIEWQKNSIATAASAMLRSTKGSYISDMLSLGMSNIYSLGPSYIQIWEWATGHKYVPS